MAAPTYFGSASVPVDNGSNAATTMTITPPASMLAGDLVFVLVMAKITATLSIGVTGGQTWRSGMARSGSGGSITYCYEFYCTFNGTWSVNPRFDSTDGSAQACNCAVMHVFRPDSTSKIWAYDQQTWGSWTSTASFNPGGYTTTRDNAMGLVFWASDDDNTWGSLTGTGWVTTGSAQYRNLAGQDISSTFAHHLDATAGTVVPGPSKTQLTLGPDNGLCDGHVFYNFAPDSNLKAYTQAGSINNQTVTTAAIDTTGATLIVVGVGSYGTYVPTVSDSNSNSWTALTAITGTSSTRFQMFYCTNPTVGAGHTFTAGPPQAMYPSICVQAWTGYNAYDGSENGASGGNPAMQPGSVIPSTTGTLIVTGVSSDRVLLPSIDSGFCHISENSGNANSEPMAFAYKVKGSSTTVENPSWVGPYNMGYYAVASIAVFNSSGIAPTVQPTTYYHSLMS